VESPLPVHSTKPSETTKNTSTPTAVSDKSTQHTSNKPSKRRKIEHSAEVIDPAERAKKLRQITTRSKKVKKPWYMDQDIQLIAVVALVMVLLFVLLPLREQGETKS